MDMCMPSPSPVARTGQQTMRTGHLASSGWHLLNAEHVLMVNSCMPGTRRVQGRGQCAECRLQPEPVVDWVQHWRAAPGSPLNPAPHAHSGLRQGEQAWGNTAEQFFIKINRGGRAKGVLRASGVKPPLLASLWPRGPQVRPRNPSVFGVCVQTCTVGSGGDGEFLDNYLSVRIICRFRG